MAPFWKSEKIREQTERIQRLAQEDNSCARRTQWSGTARLNLQRKVIWRKWRPYWGCSLVIQGTKNQNILGLDRLDILKEILTETEKKDLLKEVEKLEERRNNEDEFERKKGMFYHFYCTAVLSRSGTLLSNMMDVAYNGYVKNTF